MSPEATRRLRRSTALLAVLWALSALALAIYGQFAEPRQVDSPLHTTAIGGVAVINTRSAEAREAGVGLGDRLLSVDGKPVQEWYRERSWEALALGVPNVYRIQTTEGEIRDVALPPRERSAPYAGFLLPIFAALALVGAAYLILGALVFRLRPDRAESWAFLLFSSAMATALFLGVHTYDAPFGHQRMLMNLPLIGATIFHLFTTFPTEPPWVTRHRWIRALPYGVVVAVAVAVLLGVGVASGRLAFMSFACALGGAAVAIGVLFRERFRLRGSPHAESADVVLVGVLVSFAPVMLALAAMLVMPIGLPMSLAMVWFVGFPVAVAYGIVRGQLFDIRGIARSSVAYGAATLAITGLFALLITSADAAFRRFNVNAQSPYFSVTFLFFAILVFNPLRNRLQTLVDRVFDRDRAAYRKAVREISEAMVSMLSLHEISERLLLAVTDTMGVDRAMVMLLSEESRAFQPTAWRGNFDEEARSWSIPIDHPVAKHLWMRRQELTRLDFDDATDPETREQCRDAFDALEVQLLVPILFGVDLLGLIAVGGKLSGERLGPDDRQLLRTLANQSAIAIENAQAFDEIAKLNETLEARVEERTRELQAMQAQLMQSEKMRSLGQLVAGVAHELNNPIGFVHANLQLLDDYIARLIRAQEGDADLERVREAIGKLLLRSREGTERVKKIVQDLRTFSRMDRAELSEADLNEEIERTLGLMEPRLKDGIAVERDFGRLPSVRCYPAQLNQVVMNLVMNACDALGSRGRITIRTRAAGDRVRIEVEDDGPGIASEAQSRIFEPFFTTKPVGQGTGLGLAISHGIVERHGGRMWVECPRGGGSIFRVELPREAAPPEPELAA